MTSFKDPNKTLTIIRENCLKLLHTDGSRVTYWRLPTYFQSKAFLLQNLKAKQIANYKITKKVLNCDGYSLFGVSLNLEFFFVKLFLRWLAPCFFTQILQGMTPILFSNSLYGNSQARKQRDKK